MAVITAIDVVINADDDAMVGSEGWGSYNAAESIAAFEDTVTDALRQAYPGVNISVTSSTSIISTKVSCDPDDKDDYERVNERVNDIISNVWQSWTWLR